MPTLTVIENPRRLTAEPKVYPAKDVFPMLLQSYSQGMEQVRTGTFPLTPLKIGRRYFFRMRDVHELLGIDDPVEQAG